MELNTRTALTTVTVDIVLLRLSHGLTLETLLIKRLKEPYRGSWAIPGGKLNADDMSLVAAAERELAEETAVEAVRLHQIATYGDRERDPRGRYISVVYAGFATAESTTQAGDDAAEAEWFPLSQLPQYLAFDHQVILQQTFATLRQRLTNISTATLLLPFGTTVSQVSLIKELLKA